MASFKSTWHFGALGDLDYTRRAWRDLNITLMYTHNTKSLKEWTLSVQSPLFKVLFTWHNHHLMKPHWNILYSRPYLSYGVFQFYNHMADRIKVNKGAVTEGFHFTGISRHWQYWFIWWKLGSDSSWCCALVFEDKCFLSALFCMMYCVS